MSNKVVKLVSPGGVAGPPELDLELIAALENYLKQARQGYLKEIVIIMGLEDGEIVGDYFGYCGNPQGMLGESYNQGLIYRDVYLNPFVNFSEEED